MKSNHFSVAKRLWLILLLFGLGTAGLNAQQPDSLGRMSGKLADSVTRKPVPFATVSLFQRGKATNGTLTDSAGHFELKNLFFGTYALTFSAVGYRTVQTPVWTLDAQHPTLDLGTIVLGQDAKTLQTVTVRGQKPLIEQRVDGITFNVESLPSIAGSDAADVLRRVPMLSVDANGGLSMRGSSRIRVFIDGKPSEIYASSVADALRSLPGESIVKVDVITHPSARYDAENTDGVVLITTRRLRVDATNGEVSGILGNRTEIGMGSVQHKSGKWLVKGDAYYQYYWNRNGSVLEREAGPLRLAQQNESRQSGDNVFGGVNVLYSLDSLHTLSAGYRIRTTPNRTSTTSDAFTGENGALRPDFRRQIETPFDNLGNTFTAGYTGTSGDKRKEFSLLGTYFRVNDLNRYDLSQTSQGQLNYRENFRSQTQNRDLLIQADYTQSFVNNRKWEAGGKLTQKALNSDSRFGVYDFEERLYRNDPVRSNVFSYQSTVSALYTSFQFGLKSWQFVTGLRYEYTALRATFETDPLRIPSFGNLVPNLLISRKMSKKSTLKLSYTLRLVRPYYALLNPTVNTSDSLNVQVGNPYLRPEVTRRYQLNYARNGTRLFTDVVLFFNHNRNSIESIRTARPNGVFENTWQNIGRNQRLGVATTLSWKPTPKLILGSTLTAQYARLESPALNLTNSGLMGQLVLNGSYKFPKNFSVDFYGFFDTNNIRLQGYRSGWKFYNMTFTKKSKNERLNLSLRAEAFLKPYVFIDEVTTTDAFRQRQTTRYQMQNLRLTASFKLGKQEIKGPRMRQADSVE